MNPNCNLTIISIYLFLLELFFFNIFIKIIKSQGNIKLDNTTTDVPILISDKEKVKTEKDDANFEAFYNKENTTLTQINTLDESVCQTFVKRIPCLVILSLFYF